ncbi:MAG TPA: T9SS type A sorting domain-containing protein [Bacteroidales bacterium]|nr:T9SS type A sorting domain-containing protein [Bacteroidales bacterium]
MKYALLFLLLFPMAGSTQVLFQKELAYPYHINIEDFAILPDKGYLICGGVQASTPDSSYAIIIRVDSLMQVQWARKYVALARDYFKCITPLYDGNFAVGGAIKQNFSNFYGSTLYKIDENGDVFWCKNYAKNFDDVIYEVVEQSDNTLLLIIRHGVSGQPSKILKVDGSGAILSQYSISTTNTLPGVVLDHAKGNSFGDVFIGGLVLNNATGKYMFFLAKLNTSDVLWYREYDFGRASSLLNDIVVLDDGNIAVTGSVRDGNLTDISNAYLMKISQGSGDILWAREIKQENGFYAAGFGLATAENNNIVLCGIANSEEGYKAIATKHDESGQIIWEKNYGEGDYGYLTSVLNIDNNAFLFSGFMSLSGGNYLIKSDLNGSSSCLTNNFDFVLNDLNTSYYTPDIILNDLEFDLLSPSFSIVPINLDENLICEGTVNINKKPFTPSPIIYPNPASDMVSIQLPAENLNTKVSIAVFNSQLKLIHSDNLSIEINNKLIKLNTENFKPGLYIFEVKTEKGLFSGKFVKK